MAKHVRTKHQPLSNSECIGKKKIKVIHINLTGFQKTDNYVFTVHKITANKLIFKQLI